MYQPIQFKHATTLLTLVSLIIFCANISFAQVSYSTFNYPGAPGDSTGLSGVRGAGRHDVYITGANVPQGTTDPEGILYHGPLNGGGDWTVLNFQSPGMDVTGTVLYGPNTLSPNNVRIVGSYTQSDTGQLNHGALYEGPPDGSGTWQILDSSLGRQDRPRYDRAQHNGRTCSRQH